jgi:integrase
VNVSESRKGKVKDASAHDLRRAFGFRWSMRVMPAVLQQLMRHERIETTMQFYVGKNAEAATDALWESIKKLPANTLKNDAETETAEVEKLLNNIV